MAAGWRKASKGKTPQKTASGSGNPRFVPMTREEERACAARWRERGDRQALERMVTSHLGLVVHLAKEFRASGAKWDDLVQEGNLGLLIGAQRFDPARDVRLATYATWWIRAKMLEHVVRTHGPVRIGTTRNQRKLFFNIGKVRRELERDGAPIDAERLADALKVPVGDAEDMIARLSGRDVSLDASVAPDDTRTASSFLVEPKPDPEANAIEAELRTRGSDAIRNALARLDPRERIIIRARHLSPQPKTLSQLAARFGLSRERVRQLELRAQKKMRASCAQQGLCVE